MLNRAIIVQIAFASLLVILATLIQDQELSLEHVLWAMLLAMPLALVTLRGGLGTERLEYPNAAFVVLGIWIGTMAPSLVLDRPETRLVFRYTEEGLNAGRWLFFFWCLTFAFAAGRTLDRRMRLTPRALEVLALCAPVLITIAFQIVTGRFSNYQSGGERAEAGSSGSVASSVVGSILPALPSLFLTIAGRFRPGVARGAALAAFATACILLFLSGGRSQIGFAMGLCFLTARTLGLKFRASYSLAAVAALPIAFFLVFTYRSALGKSTERVASVSGFTSLAVNSTEAVVSQRSTREDAISSFQNNTRSRLWYGPQFFAVVDEWLSVGSEFHGTFFDGIIRTLPTFVSDSKNELADEYSIEIHLKETNRFPDIDLGPQPWMQWLFEFGVLGIFAGGLLYGYVVGWLNRRLSATDSVFETLFLYAMLAAVCSPEHVTDSLFIVGRNVGAIVMVPAVALFLVRRLAPESPDSIAPTGEPSLGNAD